MTQQRSEYLEYKFRNMLKNVGNYLFSTFQVRQDSTTKFWQRFKNELPKKDSTLYFINTTQKYIWQAFPSIFLLQDVFLSILMPS